MMKNYVRFIIQCSVTLLYSTLATAAPAPEIFAQGIVSGPANDGSPTFTNDGNTIYFSRSSVQSGGMILESHKIHGKWSRPALTSFSGEWPDSSPELSPDGSYMVFQSTRPVKPLVDGNASDDNRPISKICSCT